MYSWKITDDVKMRAKRRILVMAFRPTRLVTLVLLSSTAGAYIAGAPSPRLHAPARCTIPVGCAQPDGEHARLPHAQCPIESVFSD